MRSHYGRSLLVEDVIPKLDTVQKGCRNYLVDSEMYIEGLSIFCQSLPRWKQQSGELTICAGYAGKGEYGLRATVIDISFAAISIRRKLCKITENGTGPLYTLSGIVERGTIRQPMSIMLSDTRFTLVTCDNFVESDSRHGDCYVRYVSLTSITHRYRHKRTRGGNSPDIGTSDLSDFRPPLV